MVLLALLLLSFVEAIDLSASVYSGEFRPFAYPLTFAYRRISNAQSLLFTDEPPFNGKEVILHFHRSYNRTEIEEAVAYCECATILWAPELICDPTQNSFCVGTVLHTKVIIKLL